MVPVIDGAGLMPTVPSIRKKGGCFPGKVLQPVFLEICNLNVDTSFLKVTSEKRIVSLNYARFFKNYARKTVLGLIPFLTLPVGAICPPK